MASKQNMQRKSGLQFGGGLVIGLAIGAASGLVAGWLTARTRGQVLRQTIRQKVARLRRMGERQYYRRTREVENRMRGSVAEIRDAVSGREHYIDANTLVDQVRSQLGREFAEVLEHVNLNAVGHTVYLHGYVRDPTERDELVNAILGVEGVNHVLADRLRVEAA